MVTAVMMDRIEGGGCHAHVTCLLVRTVMCLHMRTEGVLVCLFALRKRLSPPLGMEGRVGEGGGGREVGGRNEAEAVVTAETSYAVVTASYMRITKLRVDAFTLNFVCKGHLHGASARNSLQQSRLSPASLRSSLN